MGATSKIIKGALAFAALASLCWGLPFGRRPFAFNGPPAAAQPWIRDGTMIGSTNVGNVTDAYTAPEEPNVIREGNAQILSGTVWKMWYTSGWGSDANINYAESSDGFTWVQYSGNPIVTNHNRTRLEKFGSTYYLMCSHWTGSVNERIDLYSSTDGVTFTLAAGSILTLGAPGTYDSLAIDAGSFCQVGGTWYQFYVSCSTADNMGLTTWGYCNLATAPAITGPWTKYAGNPIITSVGFNWVIVNGTNDYYLCSAIGNGTYPISFPFDIGFYHSTDLIHWTLTSANRFVAKGLDEGESLPLGFVENPNVMEDSGTTYLFYNAGSDNLVPSGGYHNKRAHINLPLHTLLGTNFGSNQSAATVVQDDFVGTNGTAITAHAISPTNLPGLSWSQIGAVTTGWTATIQGNSLQLPEQSGTFRGVKVNSTANSATYSITCTSGATKDTGIVLRYLDANNFYDFEYSPSLSKFQIYQVLGGVATLIGNSNSVTPSFPFTMSAYVSNGYILFLYNTTPIGSVWDQSTLISTTAAGVITGGSGTGNNLYNTFTIQNTP